MSSDTNQILSKIQDAFHASLQVDPHSVSMETSAKDIPAWDSMGHLSLASKLEQSFNISLDVDDMMEMESVREIVRIVQAKISRKT